MRINSFIAKATGTSRRKAEAFIIYERVTIDGKQAKLTDYVNKASKVVLDDVEISLPNKIYIALHKPKGIVTAKTDSRCKTVMELLPEKYKTLFPVGRLDKETSGLLLLTNDGIWANQIMHPSNNIPRKYIVTTDKIGDLEKILLGVKLDDGFSKFDMARYIDKCKNKIEVILHEGKKRQIRRTFEKLGCKVIELIRTEIGCIKLGTLREGEFRECTEQEVKFIWQKKKH